MGCDGILGEFCGNFERVLCKSVMQIDFWAFSDSNLGMIYQISNILTIPGIPSEGNVSNL
jgi:hypothetical protein